MKNPNGPPPGGGWLCAGCGAFINSEGERSLCDQCEELFSSAQPAWAKQMEPAPPAGAMRQGTSKH